MIPPDVRVPSEFAGLAARRAKAAAAGKYRCAHNADKQLVAAKAAHEATVLRELNELQQQELRLADEAFLTARMHAACEWDARLTQLHTTLADDEAMLLERQQQDAAILQDAQAQRASFARPKFSPALLNLRHVERMLATQGEYIKADAVRRRAHELTLCS
jgi:hypothetical protein